MALSGPGKTIRRRRQAAIFHVPVLLIQKSAMHCSCMIWCHFLLESPQTVSFHIVYCLEVVHKTTVREAGKISLSGRRQVKSAGAEADRVRDSRLDDPPLLSGGDYQGNPALPCRRLWPTGEKTLLDPVTGGRR